MDLINKTIYEAGIIANLKAEGDSDISKHVKHLKKTGVYCIEVDISGENIAENLLYALKSEKDVAFIISGAIDEKTIELYSAAGAKAFCLSPQDVALVDFCKQKNIKTIIACDNLQMPANLNADENTIVKISASCEKHNFEQAVKYVQNNKGILFVLAGEIGECNINDYLAYENVLAVLPTNLQLNKSKNENEREQMLCAYARTIKKMMGFELCHMGINTQGMEEAKSMANLFKAMFDFDVIENPGAVFSQSYIEFMAPPFFGKHGHIAIGTNYVDRARSYLERRGFEFNYDSIKTFANSTKIVVIYMKNEIAGFAVHLLQK